MLSQVLVTMPKSSHLLRLTARPAQSQKEVNEEQVDHGNANKRVKSDPFQFDAAFGLPWDEESFIARACEVGHPLMRDAGVPDELVDVVDKRIS